MEYEFNGDRARSQAYAGDFAISISGATRDYSFDAASLANFFAVYQTIVLSTGATYKFGGIVTSIVGTVVTVSYTPTNVSNGTYSVYLTAPLPIYGFLGSTTSGSNIITGVAPDDFGFQVGQTIWSDLFYGFCKIQAYNSGTAEITMSVVAQDNASNAYFGPYNSRKTLRTLKGVQTILSSLSAATLFKKGDYVIDNQAGIENKYLCVRTGYFNQTPYAVFSGLSFTLSADTSRPLPLNAYISFRVKPASNLTNFKIGTGSGTDNIVSTQPITGGVWTSFDVRFDNVNNETTVFFGGLGTTSTEIQMIVYPAT
jgi:hypothetical protein